MVQSSVVSLKIGLLGDLGWNIRRSPILYFVIVVVLFKNCNTSSTWITLGILAKINFVSMQEILNNRHFLKTVTQGKFFGRSCPHMQNMIQLFFRSSKDLKMLNMFITTSKIPFPLCLPSLSLQYSTFVKERQIFFITV